MIIVSFLKPELCSVIRKGMLKFLLKYSEINPEYTIEWQWIISGIPFFSEYSLKPKLEIYSNVLILNFSLNGIHLFHEHLTTFILFSLSYFIFGEKENLDGFNN